MGSCTVNLCVCMCECVCVCIWRGGGLCYYWVCSEEEEKKRPEKGGKGQRTQFDLWSSVPIVLKGCVCVCLYARTSIPLNNARNCYFRDCLLIKKRFGWISRWINIVHSCRNFVNLLWVRFVVLFELYFYESMFIYAAMCVPWACLTLTCQGTIAYRAKCKHNYILDKWINICQIFTYLNKYIFLLLCTSICVIVK